MPDNFPIFWKESQNLNVVFPTQKKQDRPQKYVMASWIQTVYEEKNICERYSYYNYLPEYIRTWICVLNNFMAVIHIAITVIQYIKEEF